MHELINFLCFIFLSFNDHEHTARTIRIEKCEHTKKKTTVFKMLFEQSRWKLAEQVGSESGELDECSASPLVDAEYKNILFQ